MGRAGLSLLAATIVLCGLQPALAQNDALRGLQAVRLHVARLSADAQKCGLDQKDLLSVVQAPFHEGTLAISDAAKVFYYVNVNTIHMPWTDFCVSNLRMEVYTNQYVQLAATDNFAAVSLSLWESAVLFGAPSADHRDQVLQALGSRTQGFLEAFKNAQAVE